MKTTHNITKSLALAVLTTTALVLTSCGAPRVGSLYTDVTAPVAAGPGTGTRTGTAKSTTYCGLVAVGDASIEAAKKNGNITTVNSADEHVESILGIVTTYTTTVRGN